MAIVKVWELLPNSDFGERDKWRNLGDNMFSDLRVRLLFVRKLDPIYNLSTIMSESS